MNLTQYYTELPEAVRRNYAIWLKLDALTIAALGAVIPFVGSATVSQYLVLVSTGVLVALAPPAFLLSAILYAKLRDRFTSMRS